MLKEYPLVSRRGSGGGDRDVLPVFARGGYRMTGIDWAVDYCPFQIKFFHFPGKVMQKKIRLHTFVTVLQRIYKSK
jgi:hypothetical protein